MIFNFKSMEETWKSYNQFFVSNFGRIKNKHGEIRDYSCSKYPPSIGREGLHRIVYKLFVGVIPENYHVYKKDRSIFNCHVENLILLSPAEAAKFNGNCDQRTLFSDFTRKAREVHGDKYIYDEGSFKSIGQRINIICPKHGTFKQRGLDHCSGHGCRKCHSDKNKTWTEEQDQFVIENYSNLGALKCSEILNKSRISVYSRARSLGVGKKTKMYLDGRIPNSIFSNMRRNSIIKDVKKNKVSVTREYLDELFDKQGGKCALTGFPIVLSLNPKEMTASLDRIDSAAGYEIGNVQWVHRDINWMKNKFNDAYFYKMCKAVANNRTDLDDCEIVWEEREFLDTVIPKTISKDLNGNPVDYHAQIKQKECSRFSEEALFG